MVESCVSWSYGDNHELVAYVSSNVRGYPDPQTHSYSAGPYAWSCNHRDEWRRDGIVNRQYPLAAIIQSDGADGLAHAYYDQGQVREPISTWNLIPYDLPRVYSTSYDPGNQPFGKIYGKVSVNDKHEHEFNPIMESSDEKRIEEIPKQIEKLQQELQRLQDKRQFIEKLGKIVVPDPFGL